MAEQDLIEQMRAHRGYVAPAHEYLAARYPDFLERYERLAEHALLYEPDDTVALPTKYRELYVIGMLTALRASEEAIARHIDRAFAAGLTEPELLEAFQAGTMPGGAPPLWLAMRSLLTYNAQAEAAGNGASSAG